MRDIALIREQAENERVATIGEAIFDQLHSTLAKRHVSKSDHIAIDIESGDYVIGKTGQEVCELYEKRFGSDKPAYTRRIGGLDRV